MNLSNQPKNFTLLIIGCISIGIIVTLTSLEILIPSFIEMIRNKNFDILSLPRHKLISMQVIEMIGVFFLPPVLFALFSKNDFLSCFNLDKLFTIKKYLLASAIALLLFPVLINFQYWAMSAPLPESFKTMAELQKAMNEKLIGIFLNEPGLANLGLMVVIIGIGAGLTEELFFRGFLMPWIEKITKNTWVAIILSGTIFSFFHANFYDFFPIVIVGILFGYIYSKTRDLKLNIFIHALYNSAQVILNYLHENKYISANLEEVKSIPILIWIICLCIVAFLIYKLVKDYEHLPHSS
ncbi:MAG: lysostaphin resistance A-like protein [Chitinophagales bacterium]|jgi:membrane protease YdiL (CAAX protease family)|nr:CPBP family intramembrane metalloprotease [Sphingobacteriales bacterium]